MELLAMTFLILVAATAYNKYNKKLTALNAN